MKNVNRDLIFRIVVSILTFICVLLLFSGWIKLKDGDLRKDAKKFIKEYNSILKDVDRDDLKRLEGALEEEDINISPKDVLDNCKKIGDVVSDVAVTPAETVKLVPAIIGVYSELTNEDVIDSNVFGRYIAEDLLEEAGEYKGKVYILIIFVILFFATFISGVAVTILHATNNKKLPGYSLAICSFLMLVAYLVAVISINSWSDGEFYEKLVTLTAAPVWMFILSVASLVIWIEKDKIGEALFGKNPSKPATVAKQAAPASAAAPVVNSGTSFCPNCGTKLDADASFCPECGTRI